jgi:predicted transposase YdaD
LEVTEKSSIELNIISLIVGKDSEAIPKAQKTVAKSREIIDNSNDQEKILQLIQTVLLYKLKNFTRESIEKMFTLDDLRKTRYFQDVAKESKQEGIRKGIEKEIKALLI